MEFDAGKCLIRSEAETRMFEGENGVAIVSFYSNRKGGSSQSAARCSVNNSTYHKKSVDTISVPRLLIIKVSSQLIELGAMSEVLK